MYKIDAHVHFKGGQEGCELLERLGIKALNISVADSTGSNDWRDESRNVYGKQALMYPEHYAWITSFDLPDYSEPDAVYAERVIAELEKDFANGAVGCKAWKNIGMELKGRDGAYVMIDDPIFKPIFDYLERTGRSAVMHIGEPKACWLPLDPDSPHYGYYSEHPQWHMHGRSDMPSHEQLMAARDHLLELHPDLPVIGAHYGSLEYDMAEVARRFERFPNFAVDTSGRLGDSAWHDRETMRTFYTRYQDRILWGTDQGVNCGPELTPEQRQAKMLRMEKEYELEWNFFATDQQLDVHGRASQGLALPDSVLAKVFHDNACAWYPGLKEARAV